MIKRIEKLEAKTEALRTESAERQEILLKLEQLENQNSIEALFIRLELEHGRKVTLADIIRRADKAREKMINKATKNNQNQLICEK